MVNLWRPLALAVVLTMTAGVGVAAAQTVIVRNAPAGSAVEVAINETTVASRKADASGTATLAAGLSAAIGKTEADVHVWVELCEGIRRVLLVELGVQPQAPVSGCARRQIDGLYLARGATTFVVDLSGPSPALWLRQGPAPPEWLRPAPAEGLSQEQGGVESKRVWRPLPTGLVVSGGGAFTTFSNAHSSMCGSVADCAGDNFRLAYTGGMAFWFTPYLAAEVAYLKPGNVTVTGVGSGYSFNSTLDAQVVTIAGKVGAPIGPVRIYGHGGATYHLATSTTTETIDSYSVTVDGVETTFAGGTETFELPTRGWGWMFGGGVEAWLTKRFGVYGEFGQAALKGGAAGTGEHALDDRVTFFVFGVKLHVGK